jgi:hypothetical protein
MDQRDSYLPPQVILPILLFFSSYHLVLISFTYLVFLSLTKSANLSDFSSSNFPRGRLMPPFRYIPLLTLIFIGIASRYIPHPANFTPLNLLAVLSAIYLESRWSSFCVLLAIMLFTDVWIGFHSTLPYVYFGFSLAILGANKLNGDRSLQKAPVCCLAGSLVFFVVTNFGVWATTTLYPQTIEGLGCCYLAALPFLSTQLLGDLFFLVLLGLGQSLRLPVMYGRRT